ncbi:acyl-CoA N-acyltransferase [Pilobolus umbonatus]|nr:acyl-CoA N-acyltransferase [Pilobolus umbonatus]
MIDVWYSSPFPPTVCTQPILFICEFCFKYMNSAYMAKSHQDKCQRKHPPGDEIYRDGSISIFEVDGRKNKLYCSNLCLLAKMFLDQKTLFYDVEPFLFYIMTERDHNGYHFIGYFSKEKSSTMSYNVSCILILPVFQKKGYGKYLIDFSYLLTRTEKKVGTPEKPLSLCGIRSYQSYWKYALYRYFLNDVNTHKSIEDISTDTGIIMDDVITTLARNNILVHDGHHYTLVIDENKMKRELEKVYNTGRLYVNADNLKWTPFGLNQERLARIINPFKE